MPALIRPMQRADIPALVSLEQGAFSDPWSAEAFAEELDNPHGITLVAEQNGVAGYLNAHHVLENVHINTFCVAPQRRRQGTGFALLQWLTGYAEGVGALEITLEVRRGNEAAVSLYRKCGFAQVGLRKRFYRDPVEDALILKKELSGL
ncbi:MAG: ribosomal protein S18-alanine N-acetyltransferase [Oscillospiraceae bacterium]|jgi:ribosomal-protein-alanine N-acetyltransferase